MSDRDGRIIQRPDFGIVTGLDGEHALLRTKGDFEWQDHKRYVLIERGLVFDGASVPRLVRSVLKCNALDLILPSLPHDGGYRTDQVMIDLRTNQPYEFDDEDDERENWDKVMSKVCGSCNIRWADRKLIYAGIQAGGGSSFHQKRLNWQPGQ